MLDYFKHRKLKRLMIENYELSLSIQKELDSLPSDGTMLSDIQRTDREIAAEKVAFAYDELKAQYPDFTDIREYTDVWRTHKPTNSTGLVFTSDSYRKYRDLYHPSLMWYHYGDYIYSLETISTAKENGATDLLIDSLYKLEYAKLLKLATSCFPEGCTDEQYIRMYLLYSEIISQSTVVILCSLPETLALEVNKQYYSEVAKLANTNIILTR